MSFVFQCPFCNQKLECDDGQENQLAKCPSCGEEVVPVNENPGSGPMNNRSFHTSQNIPRQRMTDGKILNGQKEYKVLTQKDEWFSGKFAPDLLEKAINAYASQGWRVIAATTASFPGFTGNREEMIIIMERDR